MLVLSRKVGERIVIDGKIVIEVRQIDRGKIRLAFSAPKEVSVLREELVRRSESGKGANVA